MLKVAIVMHTKLSPNYFTYKVEEKMKIARTRINEHTFNRYAKILNCTEGIKFQYRRDSGSEDEQY